MRTTWKLGELMIHNFLQSNGQDFVNVVCGFDEPRMCLTYMWAKLMGMFRIDGLEGTDSHFLVSVVERPLGVSLHEYETGLGFSDGCFTLTHDRQEFNPLILRAVLKSMNFDNYRARREHAKKNNLDMFCNPVRLYLPLHLGSALDTVQCPRCGMFMSVAQCVQSKQFMIPHCIYCRLPLNLLLS